MPKMIYKFNAISIKTQASFHFCFGITRLQIDTAILNRKKKAEVITGAGEKPLWLRASLLLQRTGVWYLTLTSNST